MKQWLRMSVLGITVASAFFGCGGKDTDEPNTAGKAGTGGGFGNSGGSGAVPGGSFGGSSSRGGVSGVSGGNSAGSGAGGIGVAGMGPDAAGTGGRVGQGGMPGMPGLPDGGVGGADMEPPGKGEPPTIECPSAAPSETDTCEGKGECTYVGLRCACKTDAKEGAHWSCRGSGDACPAVAPEADAACENPEDGKPLECPYPSGAECRCKDGAWQCMTAPKPGDPKPPGGPKPGEAGAGGGPPMPPEPPEPEGGAGPRGPRD